MNEKTLDLDAHADELCQYLESHDSGHPFISTWTDGLKTYLLWQYKRDDFLIDFEDPEASNPSECLLGPLDIPLYKFGTLQNALNFIQVVESVRQNTKYPFVLLGAIPWAAIN